MHRGAAVTFPCCARSPGLMCRAPLATVLRHLCLCGRQSRPQALEALWNFPMTRRPAPRRARPSASSPWSAESGARVSRPPTRPPGEWAGRPARLREARLLRSISPSRVCGEMRPAPSRGTETHAQTHTPADCDSRCEVARGMVRAVAGAVLSWHRRRKPPGGSTQPKAAAEQKLFS